MTVADREPTLFSALCATAGVSLREAADWLGVRDDTARGWAIGRRPTPPSVIGDLARLIRQMERDATRLVQTHRRRADRRDERSIEVSIAGTDTHATEIRGLRQALYGRVTAALLAAGYSIERA